MPITALVLLPLALISTSLADPKFGTFKVDVVSLISEGKEEAGKQGFFADRFGYRYLFTTKAHRDAFVAQPARFEVQLGGACGKMAELGGRGGTERYWLYQNKLYIFASEGCRKSFQANPEGHIERDEARLSPTPFEAKEGRAMLEKAAKWSGIDRVGKGTIAYQFESKLPQGNHTYAVKGIIRLAANGDFYDVTTYDGSGYANKIEKGKAFEVDPKGVSDEHVPTWKRAVERLRARQLPFILLNRKADRLTVRSDGVADGVASVVVNIDGATSTLWIEAKTGKILSLTNKGRNLAGIIGDVQRDFTAYGTKAGVTLPVAWTATYNGEESKQHAQTKMRFDVSPKS